MALHYLLETDVVAVFGPGVTTQAVYTRLTTSADTENSFDLLNLGYSGARSRALQIPRDHFLLMGADRADKDAFKTSIISHAEGRGADDIALHNPAGGETVLLWNLEYPDAAQPTYEILAVLGSSVLTANNLQLFGGNPPNLWEWHLGNDQVTAVPISELGLRGRGTW